MARPDWTDEDIATLRELWRDGHSGSEIAAILRKSRSAVMGKVHRLSLVRRRVPLQYLEIPSRPSPRFTPRPQPQVRKLAAPVEPQPWLGSGLSILEVGQDRCRAILSLSGGPGGLAVMCAAPTEENKPWCEGHKQIYCIPNRR